MTESYDSPEAWLASRPECVQKLAKEFPLRTVVEDANGERLYLLGYTEDDRLIMSPIDPARDYHRALEAKTYICASHLRPSRQ